MSGVEPGDYDYTVAAATHDPAVGSVKVTGGATAGPISVLLSYNVVSLSFSVTPTTIVDKYNITLKITYSTTVPKPALQVVPTYLPLSFFPQEPYHGSLQITNTHPTISIRNLTVDASQLDLTAPSGQKLQVSFSDGTSVYSLSALAGKASIQVPFTATVAPNYLDTRFVGDIVVQGNYDYSLDGLPKVGTTTTKVAVFFAQPTDLLTEPIHVINDETDGNLNDLQYADPSFLHSGNQQPDGNGRPAEAGDCGICCKEPRRVYGDADGFRRGCALHDRRQRDRCVLALGLCSIEGQSDRSGRQRNDRRLGPGRPEQQLPAAGAGQPVALQPRSVPEQAELCGPDRPVGGSVRARRVPGPDRRHHDSRRRSVHFGSCSVEWRRRRRRSGGGGGGGGGFGGGGGGGGTAARASVAGVVESHCCRRMA